MDNVSLDRRSSREVDRLAFEVYGIPTIVLMENAGRGLADTLMRLGVAGPVVICCGRGNNGGDGFVLARHLDLRGVAIKVCLWTDPAELTGDAATNYAIIDRSGLPIEIFGRSHDPARLACALDGAAWIVDALLGTGAQGEPRSPLDQVIDDLNTAGVPILAVDLPSGLDCDTGQAAMHTIRAAHTCTFVATKRGFLAESAIAFTGTVHVLNIGAPRKLIEECLSRAMTSA